MDFKEFCLVFFENGIIQLFLEKCLLAGIFHLTKRKKITVLLLLHSVKFKAILFFEGLYFFFRKYSAIEQFFQLKKFDRLI